jgi:hypothetical protein
MGKKILNLTSAKYCAGVWGWHERGVCRVGIIVEAGGTRAS